ncbi:MAG: CRISPR-associated protein Cas4 [Desulfurococcales archaeon]|nr:CRISPR-associated protein Cas4 [Desulfurococcales archaeon]
MVEESGEEEIVVFPSEIHSFAYCPRKYFFQLYLEARPGLQQRVRMFLGTIYHAIKAFFSRRRGYMVESRVERKLGNIVIRGRPDAYRVGEDGVVEIVERKSGRGPRRGVWISDMLQVSAYGLVLSREGERVLLRVEYRSGSRVSELDTSKVAFLLDVIRDLVLVKRHGIVPAASRSEAKCSKCPFREVCEELDKVLWSKDLYEPGRKIVEARVDTSFREEA